MSRARAGLTGADPACYEASAVSGSRMRNTAALAALALLAACDGKPDELIPAPEVAAPSVVEVAAADSYGEPGATVADVAFWSHPSIAFESLLLAATAGQVTAYRIETGEAAFEVPGGADDIEIFYAGDGAGAQGYLLSAGGGAYRLYAISQDGEGASPMTIAGAFAAPSVFCVGGGAEPVLYEAAGDNLAARSIAIVANGAELGPSRPLADIPGAIGCAVDPLTDEIITVSGDGAIRRVDVKTGAVFGLALPLDVAPAAAGLAAGRSETGEAQGQVALVDAGSGVIRLFDAKDGHALGAVRVKATFDLAAVETASRIAVGSANYGGVYRDGALAVVAGGDGAPIRLVPWNGVMGALSLPVAVAIDPRSPGGPPAEDGVISIEVIEP
jgi:streptogramin lyase